MPPRIFTRPEYTAILDNALNYCIEHKGLKVHAYLYMTSHIHLIASSEEKSLSDIMRDFKKFMSKEFAKAIDSSYESRKVWLLKKFAFAAARLKRGKDYKIWKDGFHPLILDTYKKVQQRVSYVHYNSVHAQLVFYERDWRHSSYAHYEEGNPNKSEVKVEPLY